jgi:hypothetical protein
MRYLILALGMALAGCESEEVQYGPNRCFNCNVICIEGVQYLDSRNGGGGSITVMYDAKTGKIKTCEGPR